MDDIKNKGLFMNFNDDAPQAIPVWTTCYARLPKKAGY